MKKFILLLLLTASVSVSAQTFAGQAGSDVFVPGPFRLCFGSDNGQSVCVKQTGPSQASFTGSLLGVSAMQAIQNGAAGTVCNNLVKLDASGKGIVTAGGETSGIVGVAVFGCGTSGQASVAYAGNATILFDSASPVAGDYVGISASLGRVTDSGASPSSGQNIGRVIANPNTGAAPANCNVGVGCWVALQIGQAGGGGNGSCLACLQLNSAANQTVTQTGGSVFTVSGSALVVSGGGSLNGLTMSDSGTAAQTLASANSGGFFSGTPGTNACYTGTTFQPLFTANVSGVSYSSQVEALCNKDAQNGYPSLNAAGQVPSSEIIAAAGQAGCNSGNFLKGDLSGCGSSSSTPGFDVISGGTNSTALMQIGNGATLQPQPGTPGIISANRLNGGTFQFCGATGTCPIDSFPVITSAAGLAQAAAYGLTQAPSCSFPGCALGYNTSTHSFVAQNVALNAAHPMVVLTCTGVSSACPDTAAVTATGTGDTIFKAIPIAANTLSSDGQCFDTLIWWKHTTGTASVSYKWNLGGTGSAGSNVTGGTATPNTTSSINGGAAVLSWHVHICRANGALTTYANTEQMQTGTTQGAAVLLGNAAIDWTQQQQINLTFSVAATDALTFQGGIVWYP